MSREAGTFANRCLHWTCQCRSPGERDSLRVFGDWLLILSAGRREVVSRFATEWRQRETLLQLRNLLCLVVGRVDASDELGAKTLKGMTTITVVVENLAASAHEDGLDENSIRTDAELKLRLAGLKVVPSGSDASVGLPDS